MPSICFYFQVHQPERLRRFNIFNPPPGYFDDEQNAQIVRKVAAKCYIPCNRLLLKLIRKHSGRFKVAFSVTGAVIEQFQRYAPEALALFQELAATGAVEFLCETYYHSLAFIYSREEWAEQVELHRDLVRNLFKQDPRVFRNTELIYSNELAAEACRLGFNATMCDGPPYAIFGRSAAHVYVPPDLPDMHLLLKHSRLSDDIAFRFSNRSWPAWPLMADKYAKWVYDTAGPGGCINLFMDYETFGEHQWAETGIFDFLEWLPVEFLKLPNASFMTPSEAAARKPTGEYDVPHMTSWADAERDLSAWLGNAMQANALYELFALEEPVKATGDIELLRTWRRLQISDHFYYMSTKYHTDAIVHRYFNPYDTPYDAFINFMNVLDDFRTRLEQP